MSDQVIQDDQPFLVSTGVTIDVTGKATVTGAVTLLARPAATASVPTNHVSAFIQSDSCCRPALLLRS